MFSLSTKGRYATKAMFELALRSQDVPVQLKDIAKTQKISKKYLGRLMAEMVSAGLAYSRRGKKGGFTLAKPSSEITVFDILNPVEGPIAPAPCVDHVKSCPDSGDCITHEVWMKTKDALTSVLEGITLEDLVNKHRDRQNSANGPDYFI